MSWPDTRLLELFGVEHPILQAPMANATAVDMAVAVAETGALGSYPCAALTDDKIAEDVATIRARTNKPINLNFFCHQPPADDAEREAAWLNKLAPYYAELGADTPKVPFKASIVPFTSATCSVVEQLRPAVVSFHFGLPDAALVAAGEEGRLQDHQFRYDAARSALSRRARRLTRSSPKDPRPAATAACSSKPMSPRRSARWRWCSRSSKAVKLPVIAAGGIGDGRSIVAAVVLGAAGVQIGTAYLCCPEATTSAAHRAALAVPARETVITNVLSGKPARSILTRFVREQGPINAAVPTYPNATPGDRAAPRQGRGRGLRRFLPLVVGSRRAARERDRRRRADPQIRRRGSSPARLADHQPCSGMMTASFGNLANALSRTPKLVESRSRRLGCRRELAHLDGGFAILPETGFLAGGPRFGKFEGSHGRARRPVPHLGTGQIDPHNAHIGDHSGRPATKPAAPGSTAPRVAHRLTKPLQ